MAYGSIKVDKLTYDNSGSDADVNVSDLPTSNSPTFTGTVTVGSGGTLAIPNVANVETAVVANTAKVTNATHTGDVTGGTVLTIAADAVTGAKIADDSVDSEHYVDGSVDIVHLANGTDGQIITWNASGVATVVGPGNDGEVLTSTGAGSPPAFEAVNAGVTLSGSTNNTLVTVTGADAMQGEANLLFDGSTLTATGDATFSGNVCIGGTTPNAFNNYKVLTIQGGSSGAGLDLEMNDGNIYGRIYGDPDGLQIQSTQAGDYIRFETSGATEKMRIGSDNKVYFGGFETVAASSYIEKVRDGDFELKIVASPSTNTSRDIQFFTRTDEEAMRIASSGKIVLPTGSPGIQFGSPDDPSASGGIDISSQTLDDYEEGTFTPVLSYTSGASGVTYSVQKGRYTKIGNVCFFQLQVNLADKGTSSGGSVQFSGLPFTPTATNNVNNPMVNFVAHAGLNASDDGLVPFCQVESSNLVTYWHDTGGSGSWNYLYHSHIADNSIFVVHGSFIV